MASESKRNGGNYPDEDFIPLHIFMDLCPDEIEYLCLDRFLLKLHIYLVTFFLKVLSKRFKVLKILCSVIAHFEVKWGH